MAMDMTTALTIKASVVGQSQITGLQTGLGKVTTQTTKATGAMARFKASAGGALGAMRGLLPVLGVGAIGAFATKNLQAADSMSKMSQRTGVAVPMLDKFRQAAELSDTSIQSLEKAFPNLARGIDDAVKKGTGPAAEAFSRLGISVADANGKVRDTDQVMLALADKFQQMPDGTEKAALASQIFGQRLGSELIPMLNMGGDAVRGMSTALTQEFADKSAAFNDKLTIMGEKLSQLGLKITEALLPFLEKLVNGVVFLAEKFAELPGPVQAVIAAIGGVSAVALVFAPIIAAVTTLGPLLVGLAPIILKVVAVAAGLAALVAAFNAIKDAVVNLVKAINIEFIKPVTKGIKELGKVIKTAFEAAFRSVSEVFIKPIGRGIQSLSGRIGQAFQSASTAISNAFQSAYRYVFEVFVNPVTEGIQFLVQRISEAHQAVYRVISEAFQAAYRVFHESFVRPVTDGIQALGTHVTRGFQNAFRSVEDIFQNAFRFISSNFVKPVERAFSTLVNGIGRAFSGVYEAITRPIQSAYNFVLNIVQGIMNAVSRAINAIRNLGQAQNQSNLQGAAEGAYWRGGFKAFAKGGVVNGPTLGLIGEGGESEYIVPASKAVGFANNILSGVRGPGAIPRFAEGGFVAPSSANVNIQTGPVTQMNGENFVTTKEMTKAVQAGVQQTLDMLRRDGNIRSALGLS